MVWTELEREVVLREYGGSRGRGFFGKILLFFLYFLKCDLHIFTWIDKNILSCVDKELFVFVKKNESHPQAF